MGTFREVKEIRDKQGRLLAQAEYLDGQLDGMNKMWNASGQLIQQSCFKNGLRHGPYVTWWENGNKKEEGVFEEDMRIGRYVWYHQDGRIWSEHDYGKGCDSAKEDVSLINTGK